MSIFNQRDPELDMGETSVTERSGGVSSSPNPILGPGSSQSSSTTQSQPPRSIFATPLGPSSGSATSTSLGFDWNIDRPSADLATGSSTVSNVNGVSVGGSPGFGWNLMSRAAGSVWPPKAAAGTPSTTHNPTFSGSNPRYEAQGLTQSPEEPLHDGISCGFCGKGGIRGIRYKCVQCSNYDRCSSCMTSPSAWTDHDAAHQFFPIKTKDDLAHLALVVAQSRSVQPPSRTIFSPFTPRHPGITCDGCAKPVGDVRHRCLVCSDYDFCGTCISDSSKRQRHHSASHPFFTIATPEDEALYLHAHFQAQAQAKAALNAGVRHDSVSCDSCGRTPIVGVRHRCLDCPDYDLCTGCASNPELRVQHDLTHTFFPIPAPDGLTAYNRALELRRTGAGSRGSQEPAQLTAKISELVSGVGHGISGSTA